MTQSKPQRTFGLSIAIIASTIIFSIIPLFQVGMVLRLQQFLNEREFELPTTDEGVTTNPIAIGGDFTGVSTLSLITQTVFAVGFLAIAVFAWRGKPQRIRVVMIAAVIGLTVLSIAQSFATMTTQPNVSQGIDSGAELSRSLACVSLFFQIAVPLYVVWYLSRAPARAFYRGYYLETPSQEAKSGAN
jgi:hypothetical protein